MVNNLTIYNFSNTIYSWLTIIGVIIGILFLFLFISIKTKKRGLFIIPLSILIIPFIICIIGFFNPKGSGGFDYHMRKEIEKLGFTYNKYNGSYEKSNIHFYIDYDFKTGSYAKIIETCNNPSVCSSLEHESLLKLYINKNINLDSMLTYLNNYSMKRENDSNIVFTINGITINVFYRYKEKKIEYLIDYRKKSYDSEGKEIIDNEDSIIIEHYEEYDNQLDSKIIEEIYNYPINMFHLEISDNVYSYNPIKK